MTTDPLDSVFKALADPARRKILDLLKTGGKTTGRLVEEFDDIGRCAVMKHLGILNDANLVLFRREGRFRINYLNPVPIRQVYDRWMSPYVQHLAAGMINLKELTESHNKGDNS